MVICERKTLSYSPINKVCETFYFVMQAVFPFIKQPSDSDTVNIQNIGTDLSEQTVKIQIRPRVYKKVFMLNSAEHEILYAHKYKNINKFSFFQAQISLEHYFSSS